MLQSAYVGFLQQFRTGLYSLSSETLSMQMHTINALVFAKLIHKSIVF